jgi:hypothetical protein
MHLSYARVLAVLFVSTGVAGPAWGQRRSETDASHVAVGAALGAFDGVALGLGVGSTLCHHKKCFTPTILAISALGLAGGVYLGATDPRLVDRALVGFSLGFAGCALAYNLAYGGGLSLPAGPGAAIALLFSTVCAVGGSGVGAGMNRSDHRDHNFVLRFAF